MGFFGGPTDRVKDSFNFYVHPLSKLCNSDVHLHVREKHDIHTAIVLESPVNIFLFNSLEQEQGMCGNKLARVEGYSAI